MDTELTESLAADGRLDDTALRNTYNEHALRNTRYSRYRPPAGRPRGHPDGHQGFDRNVSLHLSATPFTLENGSLTRA
jgi:hypothetical protein